MEQDKPTAMSITLAGCFAADCTAAHRGLTYLEIKFIRM
jgi:hypothetical protein